MARLDPSIAEIFDSWKASAPGAIEAAAHAWNAASREEREAIWAEWGYPRLPHLDRVNEGLAHILRMNHDPVAQANWRPYMVQGPDGCLRRSGLGYYEPMRTASN